MMNAFSGQDLGEIRSLDSNMVNLRCFLDSTYVEIKRVLS